MPTIDYQPLANNPGADVESQAQFLIDIAPGGSLEDGYKTGAALSAQFNKVARQSSMMTAAWAGVIAQTLNINVLDDGNLPNLIAELLATIAALSTSFTTGDLKVTLKAAADPGWVLCNDGTIGNAASGATYANADAQALFILLYTNMPDAICPVSGGRSGVALNDFNANKRIALTKTLGRALAVAGAGAGLTARALGSTVGEETHAQTVAEMATHTHAINDPGHHHGLALGVGPQGPQGYGDGVHLGFFQDTAEAVTGIGVLANGAGQAANVMQPTSFINVMIKL